MKSDPKFGQDPTQIQRQVEAAVRNGDDIVLIHRAKGTDQSNFWSTAGQQDTDELVRASYPELAE